MTSLSTAMLKKSAREIKSRNITLSSLKSNKAFESFFQFLNIFQWQISAKQISGSKINIKNKLSESLRRMVSSNVMTGNDDLHPYAAETTLDML